MFCRYRARLLVYCAMLTLLAGCEPGETDAPYESYVHPPPRLQLDITPDNLDGIDFLALRGCAVQATVLKYHSSLGIAAKASQRLLLALEYLERAPACIARLRDSDDDALADLLEDVWQTRSELLPSLIFNATLGGDEYRAFWLPAPVAGLYPGVNRRTTTAALVAINDHARRWLGGDCRAQQRELELLLSEVAGGIGGARMQRHYPQLFPPIAALEAQLNAVLPRRYRSWMAERDERLAR